jgi:Leucine-rich repeat (LRR) protein
VEWLLSQGCDANQANHFGITPIYVAVSSNSETVVRTLLEHQASPNTLIDNHSILHIATLYHFFRVAGLLLRSGADINALNKEGKAPLALLGKGTAKKDAVMGGIGGNLKDPVTEFVHWIFLNACATDNPEYLTAILRDCPQYFPLQRQGESFCSISPLSEALNMGSMKVAVCLIEHGASVKVPEENLPRAILDSNSREAILATCCALLESSGTTKKRKKLDLSHCNLPRLSEEVVDIFLSNEQLRGIKSLDLSHNSLRGLPPNLLGLAGMEKIKLEGNPLDMIPDVYRKTLTWPKIRDYLRTVKDRAQRWKSCKLLVVGQEGVGPSTVKMGRRLARSTWLQTVLISNQSHFQPKAKSEELLVKRMTSSNSQFGTWEDK